MTHTPLCDNAGVLTVWEAEARMAREGDWRGVGMSIAHSILPEVPRGSPDRAWQDRARMQIVAGDRFAVAVAAAPADPIADAGEVARLREALLNIADSWTVLWPDGETERAAYMTRTARTALANPSNTETAK